MVLVIFWITVVAESLAAGSVVYSLLFPDRKIWPPPRQHAWQAYAMWLFFAASGTGVVLLGILDWNGITLAWWLRWLVGFPLWLAGNAFALWAMLTLGLAPTFGSEDQLVARGPYRFSRNPQYVGFIAGLVGWALLASSLLTLLAALAGAVALILAPFAEEAWLHGTYGQDYDRYRNSVPRILGRVKRENNSDEQIF